MDIQDLKRLTQVDATLEDQVFCRGASQIVAVNVLDSANVVHVYFVH